MRDFRRPAVREGPHHRSGVRTRFLASAPSKRQGRIALVAGSVGHVGEVPLRAARADSTARGATAQEPSSSVPLEATKCANPHAACRSALAQASRSRQVENDPAVSGRPC